MKAKPFYYRLGIFDAFSMVVRHPIPEGDKRSDRMKTQVGKFTFAIPEGHAQAGQKVEKAFEYQVCENRAEADSVIAEKKWDVVAMVNDNLKANARSNSYQAALLPYRPSEVTPDEIKERMIRDYIRLGIPEDTARKQVEALLAATSQAG
jgi:ribosomal protein L44E